MLTGTWTGPADAPVAVLLHGGGMSGRSLLPVAEGLPDRRCFVPDLPGHGASRAIPFRSLRRCAAEVVDALGRRAREPVTLFGLSLGGFVALHLMAQWPGNARRAVISGVHPRSLTAAALLRPAVRAIHPLLRLRPLRNLAARAAGIADPSAMYDVDGAPLADAATLRDVGLAVLDFHGIWPCPPIATPTLVLAGDREPSAIRRGLVGFGPLMCDYRAGRLRDGGHGWCLDQPALAAQVIAAWDTGAPLPRQVLPASPATRATHPRRTGTRTRAP